MEIDILGTILEPMFVNHEGCLISAQLKNMAFGMPKLPQAQSVSARLSLYYRAVEKILRSKLERKEPDSTKEKNDEDD